MGLFVVIFLCFFFFLGGGGSGGGCRSFLCCCFDMLPAPKLIITPNVLVLTALHLSLSISCEYS